MMEQARQCQAQINATGDQVTPSVYATYINSLSGADDGEEATSAIALFEESRSLGIVPTPFLYNTLLSKLGRARRAEDALKYFQEMLASGIKPTHVTYGTVINACCRVGDEELAVKLFNDMEAAIHFQRRAAPYNTMIQFYITSQKNRDKALLYYRKLLEKRIPPTPYTFKLLIDAYKTLDPIDEAGAKNVLVLMKRARITPDTMHIDALSQNEQPKQHDSSAAAEAKENGSEPKSAEGFM